MSKNSHKKATISIITMLIILTIIIGIPFLRSAPFTVITYPQGSCKIEDPHFSLFWIHSVDKTPWTEQYLRTDKGFILTHSIFRTFGAGVPHEGKVLESDDGMIHYEMNLPITEVHWVIDQDVQSTIILPNDKLWKIYEYSPRFSEVEIRNQALNFWQRLLIRNCHETQ